MSLVFVSANRESHWGLSPFASLFFRFPIPYSPFPAPTGAKA